MIILDFQKEVLVEFNEHLKNRRPKNQKFLTTEEREEMEEREKELQRAALEWCDENDVDPETLQSKLANYSTNFHPSDSGRPLVLVDPETGERVDV